MAKRKPTQRRSSVKQSAGSGVIQKKSDAVTRVKHVEIVNASTNQSLRREKNPAVVADEWSEFDNLDDQQIGKAVAKDRDAAPVDDDAFWRNAHLIAPVPKQPISIRLDEDVVGFFKQSGPGYQSRINAVLRSYMEAKK